MGSLPGQDHPAFSPWPGSLCLCLCVQVAAIRLLPGIAPCHSPPALPPVHPCPAPPLFHPLPPAPPYRRPCSIKNWTRDPQVCSVCPPLENKPHGRPDRDDKPHGRPERWDHNRP